jgi:hypothetical protein
MDAAIAAADEAETRATLDLVAAQAKTELPKVEHDGRWHTLH